MMSPWKGKAEEVDLSEVVGGGSWPERSLEGATVTNLPVPGTQGSCLLVSP